jgi:hypothetical protein
MAAGCHSVFDLEDVHVVPCWNEVHTGDEDDDGIVDGCDVCPAIANPAQNDADDDHVGNECDPHVDVPGERIAFFDGFSGFAPDTRWRIKGPPDAWQQLDG